MAIIGKMIRESDILKLLQEGRIQFPPLELTLESGSLKAAQDIRTDEFITVRWNGREFGFVAEIKARTTPKPLRDAISRVRRLAESTGRNPIIIAPYFSPRNLADIEAGQVSGIDLSGNGVVVVPNILFVNRSGNPNRYPARRKVRNIYRGTSSLVARVFLLRPRYDSVQEVMNEIALRGGKVSLGTVSKVLAILDDDLVIRRKGRASELLQPDELLDRLAGTFRPPRIDSQKEYRCEGDPKTCLKKIEYASRRFAITGQASVEQYAVMPREKTVCCYCTSIEKSEHETEGMLKETSRFPDIQLLETQDPTAYFDVRGENGIPFASPIQCWLELNGGDKRQQDAALTVRRRIIKELRDTGWTAA